MENQQPYHIPALLQPTVDLLVTNPDGIYIDATMGGAGHTRAILSRLSPQGRLFGFDQDPDAMANVPDDPRFTFVRSNFRFIRNFMRFYGVARVDGILADLGVSFHHFDTAERGFSFRTSAPLDMRMNPAEGTLTAAALLQDITEEDLTAYLKQYTDLKRVPQIASAILKNRLDAPVLTTSDLEQRVMPLLNPKMAKKELAQIFQALRIVVNHETSALSELLEASRDLLKPGGRLAILSYHSGEDRAVKNFIRDGHVEGLEMSPTNLISGQTVKIWKPVIRGALSPDETEIEVNPRSRSAKLRVAERTDQQF